MAPANGRIRAFFKWLGTPAAIISMIVGTIAMVTVVYMAFATRARWAAEDESRQFTSWRAITSLMAVTENSR